MKGQDINQREQARAMPASGHVHDRGHGGHDEQSEATRIQGASGSRGRCPRLELHQVVRRQYYTLTLARASCTAAAVRA